MVFGLVSISAKANNGENIVFRQESYLKISICDISLTGSSQFCLFCDFVWTTIFCKFEKNYKGKNQYIYISVYASQFTVFV